MLDREAHGARAHAAARRCWLRGVMAGAIVLAGVAGEGARAAAGADAVITALAIEQGRHCVVARAPDAHVTVRGDFCDGRRFIKAILAVLTSTDAKTPPFDLDLDIAVDALAGFNGETLRDVTLRLSVQRGEIAAFALAAKLGGGSVSGRLGVAADHRATIRLDAGDAGAFLRWSGLYRGVRGGALNIAMYTPAADGAVDDGVASLRGFTIADEPALRPLARMLFDRYRAAQALFAFSRLHVAFKSQSGHVILREGLLTGEVLGATLGGSLDFAQNRLDLRGVVLPVAQFSPMAPIFFPSREGWLFGSDYTIGGPPSAPVLRIDPLHSLAPGVLRKLFEFKPGEDRLAP